MNDPTPSTLDQPKTPTDRFVGRLEYVAGRLQALAHDQAAKGLTDPDQKTGERWEWGQVWAHLAEFVPYWMHEVRHVLRWPGEKAVPFGRIKSDPERVAAIERDRNRPPTELMKRINAQLADLRLLVEDVPPEGWSKLGLHQTLGEMSVEQIVEEFLIGHLEEHEAQLNKLRASDETGERQTDREARP